MGAVTCLWSAGFGAITLVFPGHAPGSPRVVIAVLVAVAAIAGSAVTGRVVPEQQMDGGA